MPKRFDTHLPFVAAPLDQVAAQTAGIGRLAVDLTNPKAIEDCRANRRWTGPS
jgi:hypothetical protein